MSGVLSSLASLAPVYRAGGRVAASQAGRADGETEPWSARLPRLGRSAAPTTATTLMAHAGGAARRAATVLAALSLFFRFDCLDL